MFRPHEEDKKTYGTGTRRSPDGDLRDALFLSIYRRACVGEGEPADAFEEPHQSPYKDTMSE